MPDDTPAKTSNSDNHTKSEGDVATNRVDIDIEKIHHLPLDPVTRIDTSHTGSSTKNNDSKAAKKGGTSD